jgi:hypothetical protein
MFAFGNGLMTVLHSLPGSLDVQCLHAEACGCRRVTTPFAAAAHRRAYEHCGLPHCKDVTTSHLTLLSIILKKCGISRLLLGRNGILHFFLTYANRVPKQVYLPGGIQGLGAQEASFSASCNKARLRDAEWICQN